MKVTMSMSSACHIVLVLHIRSAKSSSSGMLQCNIFLNKSNDVLIRVHYLSLYALSMWGASSLEYSTDCMIS